MKDKLFFPMFIDLSKKKILVIGAGEIATRRVKTLLKFAECIEVVSPEASEEIRRYAKEGKIIWKQMRYDASLLKDAQLVLGATDDVDCNEQIVKDCKIKGVPVNVSHKKELCDFYFPSVVLTDDLVIGINASGKNHGKVKAARMDIERMLEQEDE